MNERIPDLPLAALASDQLATVAETANEPAWVLRRGTAIVPGIRLTRLDTRHLADGRGGVPLAGGTVLQRDGLPLRVTSVPILLKGHFTWTPIGWIAIAAPREAEEVERR